MMMLGTYRARGRKPLSGQSGQAMFELALLVPLLCLVMFAIIEYSRVLNFEQELVDATRQGCNMAWRGTILTTSAGSVAQNSGLPNLSSSGLVIITSVTRVGSADTISGQASSGSLVA